MENSTILKLVGQNLRNYREAKCLTQEELSNLTGLDRNYIGGIERGQKNVSMLTLEKILASLGTDTVSFFGSMK